GESTIGVLFGSVNTSIWEQLKPIILCYILFGVLELMCAKPYFRQFVVSKALGLYLSVFIYIILSKVLPSSFSAPITLISLAVGFIFSKFMTLSRKDISWLFSVACFMLLLIFVMYFSFSVFPPRMNLFLDSESGMYGIIPDAVDRGATYLNFS
ncbi:MAG: hypothetical protein J1E41_01485, partial [Ruminococcus sp.]|nr:hypothetical protein [Ruminococcus sp.]